MVLLVFCHGRLWRGPGLGLAAAASHRVQPDPLVQMQQATPATPGPPGPPLASFLATAITSGRSEDGGAGRGIWVGGLGLGLSLLCCGSGWAADPSGGGVAPERFWDLIRGVRPSRSRLTRGCRSERVWSRRPWAWRLVC